MDDFEDEYFNVETGARMMLGSVQRSTGSTTIDPTSSKTIAATRKQQARSRSFKQRDFLGVGRTVGSAGAPLSPSKLPSSLPPPITKKMSGLTKIEEVPISNEELKYKISKHVEANRDLYFVRLVAGSMKRSFESMINVEQRNDTGTTSLSGKVVINVKYFYKNELLHAWASIIERVKMMLVPNHAWSSTEIIHEKLIERDTTCVAFARYVAFIIMTESNNLVPRNKTRYAIENEAHSEDKLVVDLMRSIESEYKMLKQNLVQRYL
jgi:hypothetical protein